jgi:hypothetical protein
MKFLLGVGIGAALMWLKYSANARAQAHTLWGSAPPEVQDAGRTIVSNASIAAQQAAGVIGSAPVPESVKAAARDLANSATAATDSSPAQGINASREPTDVDEQP